MMHCWGALVLSPDKSNAADASKVKADSTARAPNTLRIVWERVLNTVLVDVCKYWQTKHGI